MICYTIQVAEVRMILWKTVLPISHYLRKALLYALPYSRSDLFWRSLFILELPTDAASL